MPTGDTMNRGMAKDGECPECGAVLEEKDKRRYQTTVEHVTRPNAEPCLKVGYGCPNQLCEANRDGARWLVDYGGEGPFYPLVRSDDAG